MSDITTLRDALFETLQGLKNKTIEIDQADAINRTAQTIINTAKVEVNFMKQSGAVVDSDFIRQHQETPTIGSNGQTTRTGTGFKQIQAVPGGTVTQHRMR